MLHFWRLLSNLGLAPSQLALKFQQKNGNLPLSARLLSACLSVSRPCRCGRAESSSRRKRACVCGACAWTASLSARPDEPLSHALLCYARPGQSRPVSPSLARLLGVGGPAVGQRPNSSPRVAAAKLVVRGLRASLAPAGPSIPLPRVSRGGNRLTDRPRRNTCSVSLSCLSRPSWKIARMKRNFRRELARPCAAQSAASMRFF